MSEILVDEYYIEQLKYKIDKLENQNRQLNQQLAQATEDRNHAEFRIRTELEPRIKQEERSYDFWVTQQTGEAECRHFEGLVDEVCDFVDSEYAEHFEWEEADGDLYQMILFLIKNRDDIDIYEIEEKDSEAEWIKHYYTGFDFETKYECSNCHKEVDFITKFCPNCGKKMKNKGI